MSDVEGPYMRALVIEDDTSTAKSVELILKSIGFAVDSADLGKGGLEIGKLYDYDIIILDLMLPDIDGYEVLRRLRAVRVTTPVLILSGLLEPDKKTKGLVLGADDYLTKPFDKGELVARVQAVVRRSKGHSESVIRIGRLVVNLCTGTAQVEQPLHLTDKEYDILLLLSRRKGTIVTREMFLDHLYGGKEKPEFKKVGAFVYGLSKKLAAASGGDHYIRAVRGRGYVLHDPVEQARTTSAEAAALTAAS